MTELRETAWNHIAGEATGTFYTAEKKWISRITKWKSKYPDEVDIRCINEDGSMVTHLPTSWLKISPKRQVVMSDEQRQAVGQRFAKTREKLKSNNKNQNNTYNDTQNVGESE